MVSGLHDRHLRFCPLGWWSGLVALALVVILLASVLGPRAALAEVYRVNDQTAYKQALQALQPGDELVLANGTWDDFEIVFEARGTPAKPISLRAETPGKVVISGRSSLRIAGEHLVVEGLAFRNGYSPGKAVIEFRRNTEFLANNTRLTQIAIEDFSKPERTEEDQWIALYGKNNRITHSYFAGKTNKGPTLVVRLNTPESRDNNHVVEHNFFGHRPSIGGNGGETIRIGVSDYSRTKSKTRIVRNYFERCDGEVEIISIKSEANLVSGNVFYESRGAVVFRHGGNNEVSRNIFWGNGVADTGGVRVINDRQTVKENYFEGLRGEKFLSALTIMNGVPDSPINRYHQVTDAEVSNNSFIGFDAIGLAVGSDEERSAAPMNSAVADNLFVTTALAPVSVFDDVSGIRFTGNVSDNPAMAAYGSSVNSSLNLVRADNGLLYPIGKALNTVGAPRNLVPVKRAETGPEWFTKPSQTPAQGRKIRVGKGAAALRRAVAQSQPGDVLKLRGKRYSLEQSLEIPHALSIDGRTRSGKQTQLRSDGAALFELPAGGALTLSDVDLVGTRANEAVIKATGAFYQGTYSLRLSEVGVSAVADAKELSFLAADDTTFATLVELDQVTVSDWPGTFIALSGVKLDGWYLAEDIKITNSAFIGGAGPLLSFGREGRDESTFGPRVLLQGSSLSNVNPNGVAIDLPGIDGVVIENNEVSASGNVRLKRRVLGLKFEVDGGQFEKSLAPEILGVDGEVLAIVGADKP